MEPPLQGAEHRQRRAMLFSSFDMNQNDYLSQSEVEVGVRRLLGLGNSDTSLAPAISRTGPRA